MLYTSNNINVNECKGCTVIELCDLQPKVGEKVCPCTICLIKAICQGELFCPLYFEYEELLEGNM